MQVTQSITLTALKRYCDGPLMRFENVRDCQKALLSIVWSGGRDVDIKKEFWGLRSRHQTPRTSSNVQLRK